MQGNSPTADGKADSLLQVQGPQYGLEVGTTSATKTANMFTLLAP